MNGRDITFEVTARLISLTLTDNRGPEVDQLDIELSDHDGLLAIRPRGAKLQLWLGRSDSGLVDKGTYTIDETEHSGAPDMLSIRARSADLGEGIAKKRERSWHQTTLGRILRTLGQEHDSVATIKKDRLLFMPIGQGESSCAGQQPQGSTFAMIGYERVAIAIPDDKLGYRFELVKCPAGERDATRRSDTSYQISLPTNQIKL